VTYILLYAETRLIIGAMDLSLAIPKEYYEFINMFYKEMSIEALLKHRKWDYIILIKEGKTVPFLLIY
jgi:hypothetical protein